MEIESEASRLVQGLIARHDELVGYLPLGLHRVAKWLTDAGETSSTQKSIKLLSELAKRLPHVFVVEQEGSGVEFLMFYHVAALKLWATDTSGIYATPPPESSILSELATEITTKTPALTSMSSELDSLLNGPTPWMHTLIRSRLPQVPLSEICPSPNYNQCIAQNRNCESKIHFEQLISSHTDVSLGDCSYLDTCYKGRVCKYVHYKIIYPQGYKQWKQSFATSVATAMASPTSQFLNCNILKLSLGTLGSDWDAMIIDPPWDIHVNGAGAAAPSGPAGGNDNNIEGVVSDVQVLDLDIGSLQTDGIVFLWVTGRVTDMGRQCLARWGYDHVEELVWCKTNQLARTICTGRTGHWLNHTKEHVLVGVKGKPKLNRQVDVDVLVSTTRGQSQKPEELYSIIERMVGADAKKIELFGRSSNIRPGWLTIGNEIGSSKIEDAELRARLNI